MRKSSLLHKAASIFNIKEATLIRKIMESFSTESVTKQRPRSKMRGETQEKENEPVYKSSEEGESHEEKIRDLPNIALLFFLYLLQGIPLGLSAAIPIILQNRHVSYSDQARFSLVTWPFSLKLLWAPIVDAVYSPKFGRRKSWLIPTQYLIGAFMLFISMNVDSWLGDEEGKVPPRIAFLTLMFFICNFLAATQDIAVDGWALTMLHRKNVGHASTCNSVGQTTGIFFGYVVFIALSSAEFCNNWLRSTPEPTGLVSFSSFMYFWAIVYVISTTLVAIFKKDNSLSIVENEKEIDMNVKQSYQLLWEILKLEPVRQMALILLTCKVGFAACDAVTSLKLIEVGVPKDKIAIMSVPLMPLQIILPFLISRYIVGPRPLDIFIAVVPYRLLIGLMLAGLVYITPTFIIDHELPATYYLWLLLIYGIQQMAVYCMFIAVMAFFAKVSDPRSGGTYMTLLNTLSNLGGTWPSTVVLWLVDILTYKKCEVGCSDPTQQPCSPKEICHTVVDGYYVEVILCTIIGIIWLQWGKHKIRKLQNLGDASWLVNSRIFTNKS